MTPASKCAPLSLSKFNWELTSPLIFIHYAKTVRGSLILFVFLAASICLAGQNVPPAPTTPSGQSSQPQPKSQYFSGYIAEFSSGSLTVTKKGSPSHDGERHVFLMDAQTKVEGKLRANARVTVRFESAPNGDRAVRIIVRAG